MVLPGFEKGSGPSVGSSRVTCGSSASADSVPPAQGSSLLRVATKSMSNLA